VEVSECGIGKLPAIFNKPQSSGVGKEHIQWCASN